MKLLLASIAFLLSVSGPLRAQTVVLIPDHRLFISHEYTEDKNKFENYTNTSLPASNFGVRLKGVGELKKRLTLHHDYKSDKIIAWLIVDLFASSWVNLEVFSKQPNPTANFLVDGNKFSKSFTFDTEVYTGSSVLCRESCLFRFPLDEFNKLSMAKSVELELGNVQARMTFDDVYDLRALMALCPVGVHDSDKIEIDPASRNEFELLQKKHRGDSFASVELKSQNLLSQILRVAEAKPASAKSKLKQLQNDYPGTKAAQNVEWLLQAEK